MFRVDLPVSLKVSLRLSPFSRLMPLNDASCAVVVICVIMSLYCFTRLERMVWEAASATGLPALPPAGGTSAKVPVPGSATVFAAAVVPRGRVWLALSLGEPKPIDPSLASDARNQNPPAEGAVLKAAVA